MNERTKIVPLSTPASPIDAGVRIGHVHLTADGKLALFTRRLDLKTLLAAAPEPANNPTPETVRDPQIVLISSRPGLAHEWQAHARRPRARRRGLG